MTPTKLMKKAKLLSKAGLKLGKRKRGEVFGSYQLKPLMTTAIAAMTKLRGTASKWRNSLLIFFKSL